jgi:hypothetical protein
MTACMWIFIYAVFVLMLKAHLYEGLLPGWLGL